MATIRDFVTRWGFDVDFGPLEKMKAQLEDVRGKFVKIGAIATGALAAVVVPAATLDDALRKSASSAGKVGADFDATLSRLNGLAKNFSEQLGFSATDVADSFFSVISAGFDPLSKEFEIFSNTSLKLAKVSGGDLKTTIAQLDTVMTAFNMTGDQAGIVADQFAKANFLTATSIEELSAGMRTAGPVAAQTFGQDLATTTAVLGAFAKAGFKAENGGEALKQVALRLANPVGEAGKVLERLGVKTTNADGSFRNMIDIFADLEQATGKLTESSKAQALGLIFGQESVGKFSALLGIGTDQIRAWETQIGNSNGALDQTIAQQTSLIGTFKKFWVAIKNVAATLGEPLLGPLKKVGDEVLKMVVAFRKFLTDHPRLVSAFSKIVGAILAIVIAAAGLGIVISTMKLIALGWEIAGKKALIATAKMLLGPLLITLAFLALFLIFEDFASALSGQDSMIGDLIKKYPQWKASIISVAVAVAALAIALGLAFAPITLIIALFAVAAWLWWKNRKEIGEFFDYLYTVDFGEFLSDLADWVSYLVGAEDGWKGLKKDVKDFWDWFSGADWAEVFSDFGGWIADLLQINVLLDKIKKFGAWLGIGEAAPVPAQTLRPGAAPAPPLVQLPGAGNMFGPQSGLFPGRAPLFTPLAAPAPGAAPAPANRRVDVGGITINVTGANNPEETARLVDQRLGMTLIETGDALLEE